MATSIKHRSSVLVLFQSTNIFTLLYKKERGEAVLIVGKIVNDIIISGKHGHHEYSIRQLDIDFKIFATYKVPRKLCFFVTEVLQDEHKSVLTYESDILESLQYHFIYPVRREEFNDKLNEIEKK